MSSKHLVETIWWISGSCSISRRIGKDVRRLSDSKGARTNLKIILKGIMTAEDTLLAIGHGADAIIVPNNEGRQLDSVPSSIKVLPEIVSAVRGRVPSLLIAELRGEATYSKHWRWVRISHSWVVRHHGVSILADRKGVERVLDILERELSRTMTAVDSFAHISLGRIKAGAKIGSNEVLISK
ncbi:hypothetical protein I7I51_07930 [Histoplasma capsulatum]|uniref:FMN-dependent dehydrogenase domain-containing protein n=1 Tax=Ajellomyces capsulatus TaxID=5037 RepID=A0A8A1M137_AJECA|nr:hypothetical protein I7I51_07930 [Histoplasma capsulatum]